jgi:kynurenine 3-monooxygenase
VQQSNSSKHIGIAGAGLVGSLIAVFLLRRGYQVSLFDRRKDFRKTGGYQGKSINMALSNRGLRALKAVDLEQAINDLAIPMHGRAVHNEDGREVFLPYGKKGQFINSISRNVLNARLLDAAEKAGAKIHFNANITSVNLEKTSFTTLDDHGISSSFSVDYLIGADGAHSAVRAAFLNTKDFSFSESFIEHGYKELHIPPDQNKQFQLEPNALHIWPRESFMLIALPNPDASFTCTLFYPHKGSHSFESLNNPLAIQQFFEKYFPDVISRIPFLIKDFTSNPIGKLVTVRSYPWVYNNTLMIGDAAHAIVPFYGQGMNAGFEDCLILNQLLDDHHEDWPKALHAFQLLRKPDTDAIAELALDNFIEMRDLVRNEKFILQKKIEGKIHEAFPELWKPLYTMVTFESGMSYAQARQLGKKQQEIMEEVLSMPGIETSWTALDYRAIAEKLHQG